MLLSPVLVVRMGSRLQRETSDMQQQTLAMMTLVDGALAAPEEVQSMQAEDRFARKYERQLAGGMRARLAQTITIERLNLLNSLPGSLVLIALIGVAILLLGQSSGNATPYTIVAVGLLTPQLMSAIQSLASFSINVNLVWPAVRTVGAAMQSEPEVIEAADARDAEPLHTGIEARHVSFSYQPATVPNVLNDVTFTVPAGTIVGLVSRSGGGKTSLFRLLLRFYDPQQGDLSIGGLPIQSYTLKSLRRHVALMVQKSAFFHDSMRENFRIAAPDATDAQIAQACVDTGIWPVMERCFGARPLDALFVADELSGGEQKRVALARVLLRRPSIVLLDEPTVGIDAVDKVPLADVIRRTCAGRTVISVDHDLVWQTRLCDRFLVLDRGAIVDAGTSAELLSRPGLFRDLYEASRNEPIAQPAMPAGAPPPGAMPAFGTPGGSKKGP
jgi:ABC-type multidrug transport system fused ATPase/permease subunit